MDNQDNGQSKEPPPYKPQDVFAVTMRTGLIGGAVGVFIVSVHTALSRRNVGAMSVFTRGGSVIGLCAFGPATYAFTSRVIMNMREKADIWPVAIGGFLSGGLLGLPFRRMPHVLGFGAFVSIVHSALYMCGGGIDTPLREECDDFERKEIIRRTTRVPVAQTIAEIGEGRGFYPPGYEERRRERIKEKYGFEIKPASVTLEGSK